METGLFAIFALNLFLGILHLLIASRGVRSPTNGFFAALSLCMGLHAYVVRKRFISETPEELLNLLWYSDFTEFIALWFFVGLVGSVSRVPSKKVLVFLSASLFPLILIHLFSPLSSQVTHIGSETFFLFPPILTSAQRLFLFSFLYPT